MIKLIVINLIAVMIFMCIGCAHRSDYKYMADETEHYGLYRFDDKGNKCYVYTDANHSTVSCVKDK